MQSTAPLYLMNCLATAYEDPCAAREHVYDLMRMLIDNGKGLAGKGAKVVGLTLKRIDIEEALRAAGECYFNRDIHNAREFWTMAELFAEEIGDDISARVNNLVRIYENHA